MQAKEEHKETASGFALLAKINTFLVMVDYKNCTWSGPHSLCINWWVAMRRWYQHHHKFCQNWILVLHVRTRFVHITSRIRQNCDRIFSYFFGPNAYENAFLRIFSYAPESCIGILHVAVRWKYKMVLQFCDGSFWMACYLQTREEKQSFVLIPENNSRLVKLFLWETQINCSSMNSYYSPSIKWLLCPLTTSNR